MHMLSKACQLITHECSFSCSSLFLFEACSFSSNDAQCGLNDSIIGNSCMQPDNPICEELHESAERYTAGILLQGQQTDLAS